MSVSQVYPAMASLIPVDPKELCSKVQNLCPDLEESVRSYAFKITPVQSYLGDMKTLGSGTFPGVLVPSFATHWGIVVGKTLYHLTFRNPDHAKIEFGDLARHGKPIKFTATICDKGSFDDCPVVGHTKYDHMALVDIGQALIEAFGNYHRLFWNCQVYAQCFLHLITGETSFAKYIQGVLLADFPGGLPWMLVSCFCVLLWSHCLLRPP